MQTRAVDWDGSEFVITVESEGMCTTTTYEQGGTTDSTEFCADEMLGVLGLTDMLATSGLATSALGVETHLVDGLWYVSPTRTMSAAILGALEPWDAERLAETVDNFKDLANDPYAFEEALGGVFSDVEPQRLDEIKGVLVDPDDPDAGFEVVEEPLPTFTTTTLLFESFEVINIDLLAGDLQSAAIYGIDGEEAAFELAFWFGDVEAPNVWRGVAAEVVDDDGSGVLLVLETESIEAAASYVQEVVSANPAEPIIDGDSDYTYFRTEDDFGDPLVISAVGDRVIIVGTWGARLSTLELAMQTQLEG